MKKASAENTGMPSGIPFGDGSKISIIDVMGTRELHRFSSQKIFGKFNVAEHLFLCGILVNSYCEYMATNFNEGKFKETYLNDSFRLALTQGVLSHDLEEVILNDIPSPVESPEYKQLGLEVRSKFRTFLKFFTNYDEFNSVKVGIHHLDKVAAFIELVIYDSLNPRQHYSIPLMLTHYAQEVRNFNLTPWVVECLGIRDPYILKILHWGE